MLADALKTEPDICDAGCSSSLKPKTLCCLSVSHLADTDSLELSDESTGSRAFVGTRLVNNETPEKTLEFLS